VPIINFQLKVTIAVMTSEDDPVEGSVAYLKSEQGKIDAVAHVAQVLSRHCHYEAIVAFEDMTVTEDE
jgi:hypothetical protein